MMRDLPGREPRSRERARDAPKRGPTRPTLCVNVVDFSRVRTKALPPMGSASPSLEVLVHLPYVERVSVLLWVYRCHVGSGQRTRSCGSGDGLPRVNGGGHFMPSCSGAKTVRK